MSLYLDLLKRVLTRSLFIDDPRMLENRKAGLDHPISPYQTSFINPYLNAETMIGDVRLENIHDLANRAALERIPGDFMECGVWRGGAEIFMRAMVREWQQTDEDDQERDYPRSVWLADSFAGLPAPNPAEYPADEGDSHHTMKFLAVSLEEVKRNFERYGLLDEQVKFLPGLFKDTLPGPVKQLALLRIDADMYEGVTQALEAMYPLVSPGGFVIVDDFYNIPRTNHAVHDFWNRHGNRPKEAHAVDWCAVWWRKP